MKGVQVTTRDLESGEEETREVAPGDYVIVTVEPCYIDGVQTYANGTHTITVKKKRP